MDRNSLEGKWDQIKGSIKETWGELTDNDLDKVKGQKDKLIGLIQETYGETKENIEKTIDDLMNKA